MRVGLFERGRKLRVDVFREDGRVRMVDVFWSGIRLGGGLLFRAHGWVSGYKRTAFLYDGRGYELSFFDFPA